MQSVLNELSFLDIQYIWENDSDIVLFISEIQYNEGNIKRFNDVKRNNVHLAIALDGDDTVNIEDYKLNYPCFQHGYYDLLLNGDYRIIACKRKCYSEDLPRKILLKEFKERFVTNDRRLKLYNDSARLISIIRRYIRISKVMIGGSYIEDKEEPDDMDLLIYVNQEDFAKIEADRNLYNKYLLLSIKSTMKKMGFDLHVKVLVEKEVDLKDCCFEKHDLSADYLCERGYNIALLSQKKVYCDNGNTCAIRNLIEVCDLEGE